MKSNCVLKFISGVMHAGKSLMLINDQEKSHKQNHKNYILTYYKSRYQGEQIASRVGRYIKTNQSFQPNIPIILPEDAHYNIFIDEAQFLTKKQVEQLVNYVERQKGNVYAYGLVSDFHGNFFTGSEFLLKYAHQIQYITHQCACGNPAILNKKIINQSQEKNDITAEYRGVCYACFNQ